MNTKMEFLGRLDLPAGERPSGAFPERWLTACADQSIVELSGPDARRFLQGQVTCDLDALNTHDTVLGAACTPKGRAYVNFRLVADADRLLIRMPASLVDHTLDHWRKYLAFFKATARRLDGWCALGLGGALPSTIGHPPRKARPHLEGFLLPVPPMEDGGPRHELWVPGRSLDLLDLGDFERLCPAAWRLSEIRAGILSLRPELVERYVPQTFNWHSLGGISFNKGCYTGQEIIARMKYLGQLKKSLFRVALSAPVALDLPCDLGGGDQVHGELVDQVPLADGCAEGLAILRRDGMPEEPLLAPGSIEARILELPYEVTEQKVTN